MSGDADERNLEVISETYKEKRHITFVDMISDNTFLLGIIGKGKKNKGKNELKIYQRASKG